jgi:predicted protein tyrosine phosphatase
MNGHTLTICGLRELCEFPAAEITHVISIVSPETPEPQEWQNWRAREHLTMRFHDVIAAYEGLVAPAREHVERLIAFGSRFDADPTERKHLIIHCEAGVSRSTAAMATLLARSGVEDEHEVFDTIRRIRPRAWPNSAMVKLADEILGREGRLRRALDEHYRRQTIDHPDLIEYLRQVGRGAEVPD